MSFLLPLAWLAGLSAVPVIAFYLLKSRRRRRPVSTLLFWEQLKPKIENAPLWRRLRRWLSLALQLLILALIIAALARPAFDWEQLEPQRVLLLLDPSSSMQASGSGGTRWEVALDRAAAEIDRLRLQDEMAILLSGDPPEVLSGWSSSKRQLRAALAKAAPRESDHSPAAALHLARELGAAREDSRILLLSDSVWPEALPAAALEGVELVRTDPEKVENAGISLFAVRRSPVAPGDWQLDADVVWEGPDAFSGRLEVLQNDAVLDVVPVELEPGESLQKRWTGSASEAVHFRAELRGTGKDQLPLDDSAAAQLAELRPVRVLLVSEPNPFLEAALDALPLVEWARVGTAPDFAPENVDLLVFAGMTPPFEPAPGSAFLLIGPGQSGFWGQLDGTLREVAITELNEQVRVGRHADLGRVSIEQAGVWKPVPEADVLASSFGNPLVFGRWDRDPRWMVVGFDPADSDLLLRTAFPIFLGNLVQAVRGETGLSDQVAELPGRVESRLQPTVERTDAERERGASWLPILPGWWVVLFLALLVATGEWLLYTRRITE